MKTRTLTIKSLSKRQLIAVTGAFFLLMSLLVVGAVAKGGSKVVVAGDDKGRHHDVRVMHYDSDRGYLGVHLQELTDDVRKGLDVKAEEGVLVSEVIEGSPAAEAGLEDGDVIIVFDGKEVGSPSRLRKLVGKKEAGDKVKIKIVRDNKTKTLNVTIGEWPEEGFSFVAPDIHFDSNMLADFVRPKRLGVHVTEINEGLSSYFGVDEGEGLLVLDVVDESTAKDAGVEAGDVIVKVGGEDVRSSRDIHKAISDVDVGDEVEVTVIRKKKTVTLKGEIQEGGDFRWSFDNKNMHFQHAPKVRSLQVPSDDYRKELEELKDELLDLKKEIKKMKRS